MSFFKVERGWQDSEVWTDEPYSEREAWIWMIAEANFKDTRINIDNKPYILKRGQFRSSIRFMAEKFQWSKDRVSRLLAKLDRWGMIRAETATGQTIVTICNYSKYQDRKDSTKDTDEDTNKDSTKDKLEEGKEGKEFIILPAGVSEAVWKDFLKQRKVKKAPVTETVIKQIQREAEKAGWPLEAALSEVCARGWTGFKAEWIEKKGTHDAKPKNKPKSIGDQGVDLVAAIRSGAFSKDP